MLSSKFQDKTIYFVGLENANGKVLLLSCSQFEFGGSPESEEATKSPDLRLKISLSGLYNLNHVCIE